MYRNRNSPEIRPSQHHHRLTGNAGPLFTKLCKIFRMAGVGKSCVIQGFFVDRAGNKPCRKSRQAKIHTKFDGLENKTGILSMRFPGLCLHGCREW